MLHQCPFTIPAENRDFTEWRRGRETYTVWVFQVEEEAILEKFKSARKHLNGYLFEPYNRQPHITLFVCGFLVKRLQYNDDVTTAQLESQIRALKKAGIQPFEIEIGGFNSFASAPYLEVHDPNEGIARLRAVLSHGARDFRTTTYTPHLTIGLYAGAFPSKEVLNRLATFPTNPVKCRIDHISFVTYKADEIAGRLKVERHISLH